MIFCVENGYRLQAFNTVLEQYYVLNIKFFMIHFTELYSAKSHIRSTT